MPKARAKIENIEEMVQAGSKRFVRYDEGARLMSVCDKTFAQMAKDAGAVYRMKRCCLVNMDIIYEYMENFREKTDVHI